MPRRPASRPGRRRRGLWITLAAVLVVALGATGVVLWRMNATGTSAATTQRTFTVSEQTISDTVGATGTVEPLHRADLSFSSSGTVTRVLVAVGDKVSKGDRLAVIDDDSLQADLDAANADFQAAKDDLATAEDDSDSTTAELAAARSKVTVQRSSVRQARAALEDATLRSTISGTVALVNVAKGDAVGSGSGSAGSGTSSAGSTSSGSGSASSTADVTVISTGRYTVATSVGSADLAKIKKGLQAEITTTGSSAAVYGTVASVAVMASSGSSTTSGSSATFDVGIDVTGTQKSLFSGATATVSIIVEQRENVLTVPTAAITTANGKTAVDKLVNGKAVATEITIGKSYGATTEVAKGLSVGDQVVVTSAARSASGGSSRGSQTQQGGTGGFPGTGTGGGFQGGPPNGTGQNGGTR